MVEGGYFGGKSSEIIFSRFLKKHYYILSVPLHDIFSRIFRLFEVNSASRNFYQKKKKLGEGIFIWMAKKAVKTKNLTGRSHHESRVLNGLYFHFFKLQSLTSNKINSPIFLIMILIILKVCDIKIGIRKTTQYRTIPGYSFMSETQFLWLLDYKQGRFLLMKKIRQRMMGKIFITLLSCKWGNPAEWRNTK